MRRQRRALYDYLVRTVRERHVDTPRIWKNLGYRFEDQLPALKQEFIQAATLPALQLALFHLGNSLHNPHCFFRARRLPHRLDAGFDLAVEWIGGAPRFYVSAIRLPRLKQILHVGDRLVRLEGVNAPQILNAFRLSSNANNPKRLAVDLAFYLTHPLQWERHKLSRHAPWIFRRPGGKELEVVPRWTRWQRPRYWWVERQFDYARPWCERYLRRAYPSGYRLQSSGINFCLYTSDRAPYRHYPIVRQFSFKYTLRNRGVGPIRNTTQFVMADYHNLAANLRRLKGVKGVILDLRRNLGGNSWNWFLEWWAPRPWKGMTIELRLDRDVANRWRRSLGRFTNRSWKQRIRWYLDSLDLARPGQRFSRRRPLFCGADSCTGPNRFTPRRRILPVPVALIVGPLCSSSCDLFVRVFDENEFGPIIGEPSDSGTTIQRDRIWVRSPRYGPLGYLRIALSREYSGRTGKRMEGVPVHVDYPLAPTFANRQHYDRQVVDQALRAFREFRFPGRDRE